MAAVAVLLVIIARRWRESGFHWALFISTFRQLSPGWLAASLVLVLFTYYGRALRWQVMLRPIRPKPDMWNLFSATAIGFTAIVLFGRAGELVRPYLISVKERVPFSSQVAAWLLERIFDLLVVLIVFGFALTQVRDSGASVGPGLQWVFKAGGYVVGIAGTGCLLALVLVRQFGETTRRRVMEALAFLPARHLVRVDEIASAFLQGMESTRSHLFVLLLVLYTALEWVFITACYVCLFRAFPATAGFRLTDVLIFLGFVAFGSMLQIPGVGGGMQIAAVLVLTELFEMSLEVATGLALAVWLITFVVIVPFGLILGFKEGVSWRKIRSLRAEASL